MKYLLMAAMSVLIYILITAAVNMKVNTTRRKMCLNQQSFACFGSKQRRNILNFHELKKCLYVHYSTYFIIILCIQLFSYKFSVYLLPQSLFLLLIYYFPINLLFFSSDTLLFTKSTSILYSEKSFYIRQEYITYMLTYIIIFN